LRQPARKAPPLPQQAPPQTHQTPQLSALVELAQETIWDSAPSAALMDTARQVHAHALLPEHRSPPLLQLVLMVSLFPEKIAPILDSAALLATTAIARRQLVLRRNTVVTGYNRGFHQPTQDVRITGTCSGPYG
jgi:hypothetical protein